MASPGPTRHDAIQCRDNGRSIMGQDVSNKTGTQTLFRGQATRSASQRIFGSVTVIAPPSAVLALAVGMIALLLLGSVAWYVEIPQRVKAVGVLMPPDGLLDIIANTPGRIANIHVSEGQLVRAGDLLLDITSDKNELASSRLRVLRAEIALLDEAHVLQVAIDRNRMLALDEQLTEIGQRLAVAQEQYRLQKEQVGLLERRLLRRRDLADSGSLSVDALDQERGSLLQARARLTAMRHTILEYEQSMAAITRERGEAEDKSARREILHDLEQRRLERQLVENEHLVSRAIRASESGVVARINVQAGAAVIPGEILLKVHRPQQQLEAWLYLSSADAGFLQPGQSVQLRFDAYPHQVFGTSTAVVTSVSAVAVVPGELRVPLALNGPVFEIRARLDRTVIEAFNTTWALAPGTSFQADVEQRRYRLYEWVLHTVTGGREHQRA
jgi:membrane fusion protein